MSCCEGEIYKRKKDLKLQIILGTQIANAEGWDYVIIEKIHGRYGKYNDFVPAKSAGNAEILHVCRPLSSVSLHADTVKRGAKGVNNKRQSK